MYFASSSRRISSSDPGWLRSMRLIVCEVCCLLLVGSSRCFRIAHVLDELSLPLRLAHICCQFWRTKTVAYSSACCVRAAMRNFSFLLCFYLRHLFKRPLRASHICTRCGSTTGCSVVSCICFECCLIDSLSSLVHCCSDVISSFSLFC